MSARGGFAALCGPIQNRLCPDIKSRSIADSRPFYVDFPGLERAMDLGFVVTFVSPSNPQPRSASCVMTVIQRRRRM